MTYSKKSNKSDRFVHKKFNVRSTFEVFLITRSFQVQSLVSSTWLPRYLPVFFCQLPGLPVLFVSYLVSEKLLFAVFDIVNAVSSVVVQVTNFKVNLPDDITGNSSRCCGHSSKSSPHTKSNHLCLPVKPRGDD